MADDDTILDGEETEDQLGLEHLEVTNTAVVIPPDYSYGLTVEASSYVRGTVRIIEGKLDAWVDAREELRNKIHPDFGWIMLDLFSLFFDPRTKRRTTLQTRVQQLASVVLQSLTSIPEWDKTAILCRSNVTMSTKATIIFAGQILQMGIDGAQALEDSLDAVPQKVKSLVEGDVVAASEMRRKLKKSLQSASEEVSAMYSAIGMMGGEANFADDGSRLYELAEDVCNDPRFREMARLIGRMRAGIEGRGLDGHPKEGLDPHSVTSVGDFGKALPFEQLMLVEGGLAGLDALYRSTNNQLLGYDLREVSRAERGPLIILLDSSGSMGWGGKMEAAVALAGAAALLAAEENRPAVIFSFNSSVYRVQWRSSPPEALIGAVKELLGLQCGGWTEIGKAFVAACEEFDSNEQFERADVLLLSDGVGDLTEKQVQDLQERMQLHYVVVGSEGDVMPILRQAAEKTYVASQLMAEDDELMDTIGGAIRG